MPPLVSVVIPAYNAAATIQSSITSVLRQTLTDFELLVVNDGSTDSTESVVSQMADPRIRLISRPNGGIGAARNAGISSASGRFVTFLDADDLWTPGKLLSQVRALQDAPEAGLAFSWVVFISQNNTYLFPQWPMVADGNIYKKMLIDDLCYSGSNVMMRRSCLDRIGPYLEGNTMGQDWDLQTRIAKRWAFTQVREYQVLYRVHPGSVTSQVQEVWDRHQDAIRNVFRDVSPDDRDLQRRRAATLYLYIAHLHLQYQASRTELRNGALSLRKALRSDPALLLNGKALSIGLRLALMSVLNPEEGSRRFNRMLHGLTRLRLVGLGRSGALDEALSVLRHLPPNAP